MINLAEAKWRMRDELLRRRIAYTSEFKLSSDRRITKKLLSLNEFKEADTVFCYVSMPDEPSTEEIISVILDLRKTLLVPRCSSGGLMDAVRIVSASDLSPTDPYGILEPDASVPAWLQKIDFAVVPALACSHEMYRLGRGGGYYDRFLALHREMFSAVLCYELADVPTEAHDMRADAVITPKELLI